MNGQTCEACGARESTRHYHAAGADGEVSDSFLCTECARRHERNDLGLHGICLSDIVGGLLLGPDEAAFICPACGHDIEDLARKGRLGCPQCYVHFRADVEELLNRSVRRTRHRGKVRPAW